jgi:cytidylate kinase
MPVITLSRQIGSGGDEIAVAVAERLHLRLVGREIINRAACQAGVPQVALAELDELGLLGIKPRKEDLTVYCETVGRLIREWAAQDVLFLGRGSQVVLADWPGVFRVRVVAPLAMRVASVQAGSGIPADIATALVEARDKARAGYVYRYYGVQANDPTLYDMVLNMAHLTVAGAVELVCSAAHIITGSS